MAAEPIDPAAAHAAAHLAAMRESRSKIVEGYCPPWRHAAFAGLMSGVVAAQAAPVEVFFAFMALVFVGLLAAFVVMRARKGVFINGWRAGPTRRVSAAIFAVYLVIYTISWWLRSERGVIWAPLVGGAILFPIAWYASLVWMRVYRRELQR